MISHNHRQPNLQQTLHRVLHRALRDAVKWDRLPKNPAALADPPRMPRNEMRVWSTEQVGAFLTGTADDEHAALWLLLATTGLRRGEALGIRWSDLQGSRLTIARTISYVGTTTTVSEPKTSRSRRLITVPDVTLAALKSHKARQAQIRLAMGEEYDDQGWVFADETGAPLKPATVSRTFSRLVKELGLPNLTLHGLRHSWATAALSAGVPAKVASEVLGHSSIAVTLDTYSHAMPSMQEDATTLAAAKLLGNSR